MTKTVNPDQGEITSSQASNLQTEETAHPPKARNKAWGLSARTTTKPRCRKSHAGKYPPVETLEVCKTLSDEELEALIAWATLIRDGKHPLFSPETFA